MTKAAARFVFMQLSEEIMADYKGSTQESREHQHPINMADLTLRGAAVLFEIQTETMRNLLQMQARAATAFGALDYSELFRATNGTAQQLVQTTTEQWLTAARHANETINEMQRQLGRVVQRQTEELTGEMQQGIRALGQRTQQSLEQVKQLAQQQGEELERTTQEAGERARQQPTPSPEAERGADKGRTASPSRH